MKLTVIGQYLVHWASKFVRHRTQTNSPNEHTTHLNLVPDLRPTPHRLPLQHPHPLCPHKRLQDLHPAADPYR